jgi:fermentation-respiration switch protein FrsA (DUF1100 family)
VRDRNLALKDILVIGRSIGSGPAVYLAAQHPELAGLILESPFTSIDDAARSIWFLRAYPTGVMLRPHFDNYARIASVRVPLFIAVGSADNLTPPWMARKIYARANEPKKILLVDGTGHNDLLEKGGAALEDALRAFLATTGRAK